MEDHRCCSKRKKNNMSSSELPDVIIQHIQSFLRTREAARTILVSKSWLRAWYTRPFLYFNFLYRRFHYDYQHVIDRTLKSYVETGITIARFHLYVDTIQERWLNLLRRTNVSELNLTANYNWNTTLFREIFLTNSLQVLRVVSRRFRLVLRDTDAIKCLNLKKLELSGLLIDGVTFWKILCSCPLIEELLLVNSKFSNFPEIQSCPFMFARGCASLKMLSLEDTRINHGQLQTILSSSPQLEDFTLIRGDNFKKPIYLSCFSLQRAKFVMPLSRIIIDAPNLQKIKYRRTIGSYTIFPLPITITSPIRKGMAQVTIVNDDPAVGESWFHGLREFLAKFLKPNVKIDLLNNLKCSFEELRATPLPHAHQVEILTFKRWFPQLPLLYAFFTICHPKTVLFRNYQDTNTYLEDLRKLWKALRYRGNLGCCKLDENKCWRHYIKGAKLYHVVDNEQKLLDVNELRMGSMDFVVISLTLEWREFSE